MANFVEKESIFLRIAKYLIPWKGDKPVEIIRKIIFLAAAVVLVVSLVTIISFYGSDAQDRKFNQQISDIYHGSATVTVDQAKQDELAEEYPEVNEKFLPLLEQNKDVIGWITMGDPDDPFIDNVVVQGDDNAYYLDHNLNGVSSAWGAIYAREECDINKPSDNITLYGHHMRDGSMFACLDTYKYKKTWDENPLIFFDTLYGYHVYKIFAVFTTSANIGEGFSYHQMIDAKDKKDFDNFIAKCKELSLYDTGVTPEYGDKTICLSTCEYSHDNGRLVVAAVRIS